MALVDYAISHFAIEEDLMTEGGYPPSNAHKNVYESFIARINTLRNNMKPVMTLRDSLCLSYKPG